MTFSVRAPLAVFAFGAASVAYGSIATMPDAAEGQVVVTVFAGAWLVLVGALQLAALLVWQPERADSMLELLGRRGSVARHWPALVARTAFADVPVLRWALCIALVAAAAFAVGVLASDVFAWTRLSWAVPPGAGRIVLG